MSSITPATSKLENLKEITKLMIYHGTVTVEIVRKVLEIPQKIFEGTNADTIIRKISELLDVNGDKKYTYDDFILLRQGLKEGKLDLYISMISILSSLVHSATQINKLTLTPDEIVDLSIKLILYAILLPVMNCENISEWAKETSTAGQTNLDSMFELIDVIYSTLIDSIAVKNAVGSIIKFIGTKCHSCFSCFACCTAVNDKSDVIVASNMPKVEHEILNMMKVKNSLSVTNSTATELLSRPPQVIPSADQITVTCSDETTTNSAPSNSHTIIVPITVPLTGDKYIVSIPASSISSTQHNSISSYTTEITPVAHSADASSA